MLLGIALEQINLLNTHCQVPIILQVLLSGIALLEVFFLNKNLCNIYHAVYYLICLEPDLFIYSFIYCRKNFLPNENQRKSRLWKKFLFRHHFRIVFCW